MNKKAILLGVAALLSVSASASAQEGMYAARRLELMKSMGDGLAVLFYQTTPG